MTTSKDYIPILLAADENAAMPASVVMTSILHNAGPTTKYRFYIMHSHNFTGKSKQRISSLENHQACERIIFMDMKNAFSYTRSYISHISLPTFYRLLAPSLINEDTILYLDTDIVVTVDLSSLFNIPLTNHLVAGVKAPGIQGSETLSNNICIKTGLINISDYINAGVLLMNLKQMRKENTVEKFLYLSKTTPLNDQDILNSICYGRTMFLPLAYNAMTVQLYEENSKLLRFFTKEDICQARKCPRIIHYATKTKPWQERSVLFFRSWYHYFLLSPFSDMSLSLKGRLPSLLFSKQRRGNFRILTCLGLQWTYHSKNHNKDSYYYQSLHPSKYEKELKLWYKKQTGKKLHLWCPRTFNEKIQWMKLYDNSKIKSLLADKYAVRNWIKERIGEKYLVPLLGVWKTAEDIDFNKLPSRFVLKVNHAAGMNIIILDKSKANIPAIRRQLSLWLKQNYAFHFGLELHYSRIKPLIICEEYIHNNGDNLYDYKIWCFEGKAKYIMFLTDRKAGLKMGFFDLHWNPVNIRYHYPPLSSLPEKPKSLNLMINLAEELAKGFPHARVDFYELNDGSLKFGEITFSSMSGVCRWEPPCCDQELGKLFKLPNKHPWLVRIRKKLKYFFAK